MAIAFVAAPSSVDTSGTTANFGAQTTSAGNLLIAGGRWGALSLTPAFARTGDTFSQVQAKYEDSDGDTVFAATAQNIAGSANVVSMTSSASVSMRGVCFEISGAATSSAVDKVTAWNDESLGTTATPVSTASGTTSQADEILIGMTSSGITYSTTAAGSGYTIPTNGSTTKFMMEYQVVAAASSYTAGFSITTASSPNLTSTSIVTIKAASGGAASKLKRNSSLNGLGASGPFFHDPLACLGQFAREAA